MAKGMKTPKMPGGSIPSGSNGNSSSGGKGGFVPKNVDLTNKSAPIGTPPQKGSPAGNKPAGQTAPTSGGAKQGGVPIGTTGTKTPGMAPITERPIHRYVPIANRDTNPNRDGQLPASPATVPPQMPSSDPNQMPTKSVTKVNRSYPGQPKY